MEQPWHSLTADDTLAALDSRRDGLTSAEAAASLARHGPNRLVGKKKTSPLVVFLRQFLSPLIYILLVAVVVSFIVDDEPYGAWVILAVLFLNAIIGFVQETRAEKAMEALIRMAAPKARVRRDGRVQMLAATEIVPGDIVTIEAGDKVPADARLVSVSNLKVNESALTGESMPVDKSTAPVDAAVTATAVAAIADRLNIVHMGTIVTYGRATAVVTETGMNTEIGRIATAMQAVEEAPTPLQRSITKLSNYVIVLFLAACGLLVIVGLVRGMDWLEVFLLAVAAAVSAIPEGLPAVVTVVLAVGMRYMARRNAIIRKLVAVETLGSATVICSDKTGTLTLNQMTVRRLYLGGRLIEVGGEGYDPSGDFSQDGRILDPADDPDLLTMLRGAALCNDATLTTDSAGDAGILGDPTEGALVVAAAKAGLTRDDLESTSPRLDEIPFESENLYMATLHEQEFSRERENSHGRGRVRVVYVKGAVERLLPLSRQLLKDGAVVPLEEADAAAIAEANTAMASEAMRVIAVAYKEVPETLDKLTGDTLEQGLVFVGLAGMDDPPRDEARQAIALCRGAGIKVIMITGDNRITAESVARQLELPPGRAVTGPELAAMSDEELAGAVEDVSVFARIEPLHKLRIVNALKAHGHVVAMTGDGVNDALALRAADIGVAMGITGTDVAKEASDVVLTDDNFASVVAAVEEGRAIFNRLRGVIFFLLSTNLGELLALILSVLVVGKAPLLAVQIIWLNLVTDTVPAIPLGLEPRAGDEIRHPPRDPRVGLIYPGLVFRILFLAVQMGVGVLVVFSWAESRMPIEQARTLAFSSMSAFELFRVFNARSDEHTVFSLGIFRNRWLVYAVLLSIALQLMVVYVPFFQTAFGTVSIGLDLWGIAILAGGSMFAIEETRKKLFPRLFSLGKWHPARSAN